MALNESARLDDFKSIANPVRWYTTFSRQTYYDCSNFHIFRVNLIRDLLYHFLFPECHCSSVRMICATVAIPPEISLSVVKLRRGVFGVHRKHRIAFQKGFVADYVAVFVE